MGILLGAARIADTLGLGTDALLVADGVENETSDGAAEKGGQWVLIRFGHNDWGNVLMREFVNGLMREWVNA